MLKHLSLFLFFAVITTFFAVAQNTYTISGTVRDKDGMLPGAVIYVSGYKMTAVANEKGRFNLPNMLPGNYDLLIQMIGYIPFKKNVIVADKAIDMDVVLKESTTTLKEVVVKPDPNREGYLRLFKDLFIGLTPNATQCELLNPQELVFDYDKATNTLSGKSLEFLVIENKALGYRIKYLVDHFSYGYKDRIFFYSGQPFFEELKGSNSKQKKWAKAREIAYNGSIQHFFRSLYQNKLKEEGFVLNKIFQIPNPLRPTDSVINDNIKRLTKPVDGKPTVLSFSGTGYDSLRHWMKLRNEPKMVNSINQADVLVDTLVKVFNKDIKMMNYTDGLYVIYKNEREPADFEITGHKQPRPPNMPNYQISVIHKLQPQAYFYANGSIFDPRSLLYQGFWAYEKVADLVPMDYEVPLKTKK